MCKKPRKDAVAPESRKRANPTTGTLVSIKLLQAITAPLISRYLVMIIKNASNMHRTS